MGHNAEALQWMEKFAATGLTYDLAKDDDLKGLLADEAGQRIAEQMKARSQPKTGTELVCALPQADIMPEDITHLKPGNSKSAPSFIVSSIQHHTLYRVSLPRP